MSKEKVTVGRIVHYVTPAGAHCAALVIGVVDEHTVFCDGLAYGADPHQVTGVLFAEEPQTWHWPERT